MKSWFLALAVSVILLAMSVAVAISVPPVIASTSFIFIGIGLYALTHRGMWRRFAGIVALMVGALVLAAPLAEAHIGIGGPACCGQGCCR